MKNPRAAGFTQTYNTQTLVDEASLLIVGYAGWDHPIDANKVEAASASVAAEWAS